MKQKACGKCKRLLPISMFHRHKRDGFQARCKDCKREDSKMRNRQPDRREYNKMILRKMYPKLRETYYQRPEVKRRIANQAKKYRNDPRLRMRHEARWQVRRAIQSGMLIKKPCEKCGNPKSQAHHPDYYKPLEVIWLCMGCHRNEHAKAEGRI